MCPSTTSSGGVSEAGGGGAGWQEPKARVSGTQVSVPIPADLFEGQLQPCSGVLAGSGRHGSAAQAWGMLRWPVVLSLFPLRPVPSSPPLLQAWGGPGLGTGAPSGWLDTGGRVPAAVVARALTDCPLSQAPCVCRAAADPGGPPPALCAGLQPSGAPVEAGLWAAGVVRQPRAEVRGSPVGVGADHTGAGCPAGDRPSVRATCTPGRKPLT